MYIKVHEVHMKEIFFDYEPLTWKPVQHTFLVTFFNVVFQNDKHLISRLHYIVKRKRLQI